MTTSSNKVDPSEAHRRYTEAERATLLTSVADYMLFGVQEPEMLKLLSKKVGRNVSARTLYNIKNEIKARHGTAEQWLDKYARAHLADFYRQRIEELQYLQANLFLILDNEKAKGIDKVNVYRYNTIAKTIIDNSKVLAEFGLGMPIIAKIKDLLPVDINELNKRVEKQKTLVENISNDYDINVEEPTQEDELEQIRKQTNQAKSALSIQFDNEGHRRLPETDTDNSEDSQRVF